MSIAEIENEIKKLQPEEVSDLLAWLRRYHAELWDKQIEADLASGRLDPLLSEVKAEIEAGLAKPL